MSLASNVLYVIQILNSIFSVSDRMFVNVKHASTRLASFFQILSNSFSVIDGSSTAPEEGLQSLPLSSQFMGCSRPIPILNHTRTEKFSGRKGFSNRCRLPVRTKIYTLAEVQSTTNNFSQENLLGEGSLGAVYRAEFPDGQVK